jgi:hypothetical protein
MKKSQTFKMLALVTATVAFAACGSSTSTSGTTTDNDVAADTGLAGDSTATTGDTVSDTGAVSCPAYVTPTTDKGCTGAADKTFVDALKTDDKKSTAFADQVRECTLTHGCMAKGSDCPDEAGKVAIQGQCIAQCVVDNLDPAVGKTTLNCAWCYGAYSGACGFNHCLAECATDTPECTPCLAKWCDPVRDACKDGK